MLEHKCEVCGRMSRKKIKADNKVVCAKHRNQFRKYGEFRDTSPRTHRDKNEIIINNNVAYINMYDRFYNVVAKSKIDTSDIDMVKNIKWRLNNQGYVINNSHSSCFLHSKILGCETFVDHINGDRLDNRRSNLRIVTRSQNQMNVCYRGVYEKGNGKWCAKIKLNQKSLNLGTFIDKDEALFCRWYAERVVFKEFAYPKTEPVISDLRKKDIKKMVDLKVQRLQ